MRKAYLMGYYGMLNSGDDALMNVVAWGAQKYLKQEELALSSFRDLKLCNGEAHSARLNEQQRFRGQNRLKNYMGAIDSQRIIFGGGSTLHSLQDINVKRDMLRLSAGRNHLALGVGLGPFENTKAEKACAKLLNACEYVGVRDRISYEVAQDIAPHANVDLTFDLAPQLLLMEDFDLQSIERSGIAVCLCPHERLTGNHEAEQARLRKLAQALETIQFFTGETIYFIDFNGHPTLGDAQVHQEIASMLDENVDFRFVKYDANPLRVLQRMAAFKFSICMRLHATIFSFITETPCVSLNYHRKCQQWCEQVGSPKDYSIDVNDFDPQELANLVCMGVEEGFKHSSMSVDQALTLSMKNWRTNHESVQHKDILGCYSAI